MPRAKPDAVEGTNPRPARPGADFLQLDPAAAPAGGRAAWLAEQVRAALADGRLVAGDRLPPSRVLGGELGFARGVVTEAYGRLRDEGLVDGATRRGTVVTAGVGVAPVPSGPAGPAATGPTAEPWTPRGPAGAGTGAFERLRHLPAEIDLSPGLPDLTAFPRAAWLRAERAVLQESDSRSLGYADAQGTPELRRAVSRWLAATRGIDRPPDDVVVVAGVAQALSAFAQLRVRAGLATVAVEDPGSVGARMQLHSWGVATPPVPVDAGGLDLDALERLDPPAVMVTPAHQFPTGVVLDGDRRARLLRWAAAQPHRLVVEDDYDAEHRYDRAPVAALAATRPDDVYYAGSVSKILAPALRTGWVVPPPSLRDELVDLKRDTDLGNATLPQLVLARLMDSGDLERHLRLVRRRHRARRDAMIRALATHLPGARVLGAAAGLHLTVELADAGRDVDDEALAVACLERGVKVHPLSWHRQGPGAPGLVLGYAACAPDRIAAGVALLGETWVTPPAA